MGTGAGDGNPEEIALKKDSPAHARGNLFNLYLLMMLGLIFLVYIRFSLYTKNNTRNVLG